METELTQLLHGYGNDEMIILELTQLLHGYGDTGMIDYTVDRWIKSGAKWSVFYKNYPFGQGIPPMNVKHILENHEILRQERLIQERQERLQEARSVARVMEHMRTHGGPIDPNNPELGNKPSRVKRQIDHNLSQFIARNYLLNDGDVPPHPPPPPAAGGKRKSRRTRKSKKSRKGKTQKKRRQSTRRRR